MQQPKDYIAVFDSGVGGISVLRELVKQLPNERFLYYGDSANAPYGVRSAQQVQQLCMAAVEKLMGRGIKALVIACNTATAAAIHTLRQTYPDLIIIGIEPAVKLAADRYPGGTVGVLATPVTLQEEKFRALAQRCREHCRIVPLPAPGLADLVEAGKANSPESLSLLEPLLQPWANKLDVLVLGCTHYPFAQGVISRILGPDTPLLDGSEGTARETRRQLASKGLLYDGPGEIVIESSSADGAVLSRCRALLRG